MITNSSELVSYKQPSLTLGEPALTDEHQATIAYFSMEIAVDPKIPTYAGGLGVLAGDALRSAADRGLPMVGVTLASPPGIFSPTTR